MNNENLIKASLIFGGGFLVFLLLKPKFGASATTTTATKEKKSFDSVPVTAKDLENADIVAKAYTDALQAGEPPAKLTELNTECMKEFGMRCYTENGKLIVCDVQGKTIITK